MPAFFFNKHLICPNHFGFKVGESCINQLLNIIHDIYNSFDKGLEVWRLSKNHNNKNKNYAYDVKYATMYTKMLY